MIILVFLKTVLSLFPLLFLRLGRMESLVVWEHVEKVYLINIEILNDIYLWILVLMIFTLPMGRRY